jgi:general secretion pathway protein G
MEEPSPALPPLLPAPENYTGARLLAALLVGMVMGSLAGLTVVQFVGKQLAIYPVRMTRERLNSIRGSVEEYRKAHTGLPVSLSVLRVFGPATLNFDEEGEIRDGWGRPIMYTTDGTNYVAYSLGYDGKPGGVGVDRDLTSKDTTSLPVRPTFGQLLDLTPSERVANAVFASGLLSAVLAFFVIRPKHFVRGQRPALLGSVILTSVVAGMMALFIAALHSSGH